MSATTITVRNVSKRYRLGTVGMTTLRDELQRRWARFRGDQAALGVSTGKHQKTDSPHEFWALRDVSFDVEQGDVVGLIGRNGAGKSTMLKILSRITEPTLGEIRIRGRVASLLEDLQHGALTRAVSADQPHDVALFNVEADVA